MGTPEAFVSVQSFSLSLSVPNLYLRILVEKTEESGN